MFDVLKTNGASRVNWGMGVVIPTIRKCLVIGLSSSLFALPALAAEKMCAQGNCESSWKTATQADIKAATDLGEDYKAFLQSARTELSTVTEAVKLLKRNGFAEWHGERITAGKRYYRVNRDRALFVMIGGRNSIKTGVRIAVSHIDSPRIELKGRPLQKKEGFALFQTNYHGSLKPWQWTNIPLALLGRVDKTNGETVQISIGLNPDEPVFIIPGLSPHIARSQRAAKGADIVPYESLDPIVASGPAGDIDVVDRVLAYLKDTYNIEGADLVSAELALVPAMPPRDIGFDRRLIAAYGQDDKVSVFTSLIAAINSKNLPQTSIVFLADNEETGSGNVTGAKSTALTDLIGEMLYAEVGDRYRQPMLTKALRASKALSADVNPGVNPMKPSAWELSNAPRLGYGVNIKRYGRGFNANSEFIAWTRAALDTGNIPWQTTTYKVGVGGGGTLGGFIAYHNIDTIDFGVPVLSIHTPYAISDKMDVLALSKAFQAFLEYSR